MIRIMLDAGHCTGYNQSDVYKPYREGNMTWSLHNLLKAELVKYGFRVDVTRGNQSKNTEVYDRGVMAAGYDLFLSLHSNACGSEKVRRVVTIRPHIDQNGTKTLAKALGAKVTEVMGIEEPYEDYYRTYTDYSGKVREYYGVLRAAHEAGCKRSIIIEHSFHTNLASAMWLYNNDNLMRIAKAEAEVIAKYFGIEAHKEESTGEKEEVKTGYTVGDKYIVKKDDVYTTGKKVASFCVGKTMTVKRVLPGKILLEEINSWVVV